MAMVFLFVSLIMSGANSGNSSSPFGVLDTDGARGPVAFSHKIHEGVVNPDPLFPHRNAEGDACAGCHHSVKSATAAAEYQACRACHGPDGQPENTADKEGFELSNREISHRACIGCHRAAEAVSGLRAATVLRAPKPPSAPISRSSAKLGLRRARAAG